MSRQDTSSTLDAEREMLGSINGWLLRVEDRLERLLAAGWRNARAEAGELAAEADALAEQGLTGLATRLRKVATAKDAREALMAIALALAACRLLRARLPFEHNPEGDWKPLTPAKSKRAGSTDRLLPVSRIALDGGEAWACVRRRGATASELVLIAPIDVPTDTPSPSSNITGILGNLLGRQDTDPSVESPWLSCLVDGQLRWQVRYPLGLESAIEYGQLEQAIWQPKEEAQIDSLTPFYHALANGQLNDDQPVLSGGGALRIKQIEAIDPRFVLPDEQALSAFRAAARQQQWALVWNDRDRIVPLALLVPGGFRRKPEIIHLVPGNPSSTLAVRF